MEDNGLWRSATIVRYAISIISSPIATKLGLDALQSGKFVDWLATFVMGAITFGPPIWNLIFRPSNNAMNAAVAADRVLAGDTKTAIVQTPSDVPNLVIKASNANIGHS